jgi:hypothetical protein
VHNDPEAWGKYVKPPEHSADDPPWKRYEDLMKSSRTTWRELPLPGDFDLLSEQSQKLLERAERSYSSTVDDLGRSAHLLALVLECELKQRLFDRIPKEKGRSWTLGSMLPALKKAIGPHARRDTLHAHVCDSRPLVERICGALDGIKPLEGGANSLVKVRNGVAHGDEAILASLDRIQVDAIKRHLALEAPEDGLTILQALAQLPRLPRLA